MERMQAENESKLDSLLTAYRDACPDPESSPEFMPNLWQKIEARRRIETTSIFKRLAQVCVAATAVAVLILSTISMPSSQDTEVLYSSTYTEVIAADHAEQAYLATLPADLTGDLR